MKRLILMPKGWPCTLKACPPGHFVWQDTACFKTEYRAATTPENPVGRIEAYNEAGEFFIAGAATEADREKLVVQPVVAIWVEDDE